MRCKLRVLRAISQVGVIEMNALTSEMDGYYCITAKEAIHINLTCVVIAAWFKPPRAAQRQ